MKTFIDQNWTERNQRQQEKRGTESRKKPHRISRRKKQAAKMLVNRRQRIVHVHKVNGLELRKTHTHTHSTARASENIHWSIYTHSTHMCVHLINSYSSPLLSVVVHLMCVCVSVVCRWMWISLCMLSVFCYPFLYFIRIGHKNLPIEVYGTKYAWLHSIRSLAHAIAIYFSFRSSHLNVSVGNLFLISFMRPFIHCIYLSLLGP